MQLAANECELVPCVRVQTHESFLSTKRTRRFRFELNCSWEITPFLRFACLKESNMCTSFIPIITSILDTDAYKLHMQQAVFRQKLNVDAVYEFINRNPDDYLGAFSTEIRKQIDAMGNIRLSADEFTYLKALPQFKEDYLIYLQNYRFNPSQVEVLPSLSESGASDPSSKLQVRISGPWVETILWEIPILAIISQVTQAHRHPSVSVEDAMKSLSRKLDDFTERTKGQNVEAFRVCDFGTRRRFSKEVQEAVVRTLSTDPRFAPFCCGTSNFDLGRRLNVRANGTQAHEWFQAFQQLAPSLRDSQTCALDAWLEEYPNILGIALTDCITMDAFLADFTAHYANAFVGLRHDSGDPETWGRKAIAHYKKLDIDPKSKTLIFSDGLSLVSALDIYRTFAEEVGLLFGIGTQLTCSIEGVKPLNIVIKMIRCNSCPVAKVSDAPGKNICESAAFVEQLKRTFEVS